MRSLLGGAASLESLRPERLGAGKPAARVRDAARWELLMDDGAGSRRAPACSRVDKAQLISGAAATPHNADSDWVLQLRARRTRGAQADRREQRISAQRTIELATADCHTADPAQVSGITHMPSWLDKVSRRPIERGSARNERYRCHQTPLLSALLVVI